MANIEMILEYLLTAARIIPSLPSPPPDCRTWPGLFFNLWYNLERIADLFPRVENSWALSVTYSMELTINPHLLNDDQFLFWESTDI